MKTSKRPRTSIIEHGDGYHINYQREDGFSAYIDTPYFSAICLGYFPTQDSAWHAIKEYQIAYYIDTHTPEKAAALVMETL